MVYNSRIYLCGLLFVLLLIPTGCKKEGTSDASKAKTLRLSMIPTTDPGKVIRESQPLVEYLEREVGGKVDMTVPTNYAAVVEAIANDQVDIAYLGGFTYVQASKRAGVVPLVQRERDRNFHSLFITQKDSGINSLADLKGRKFAFGDVNSTSGHLMPEYFMREAGVDLAVISGAIYSGGHDATALAVANKKVDAGALDETVFQRMVSENKLDSTQVRVFYTTPPFFDYIWVARKSLDPKVAEAFSAAMLKLDGNEPTQKIILDLLTASKYVKAQDSDYNKLRQAATDAGLLK
ncbi:MAG TPA: putative selenate ABC transporter substrate-binding protein [Blastocatellia bacterium]|nr:putative selenate ABC transporter substrate-binding protein [Blastocatellia bacterium]